MKTIEIKGSFRTEVGKKSSKETRKIGNVPCVIYGKKENIHFQAPELSFKKLVYTPEAHLVKLKIDDKEYRAVLKDIQFHPVSDNILHADFMEISDNKPVIITVPIKVTGDSVGVIAGGKLVIKKRKLKVKGIAEDLPEVLPIDITKLEIHSSIKIRDLSFPKLELLDQKNSMVLTIATSRVAQKTDVEIADEELAAAAAADSAESSDEATPQEGSSSEKE